MSEEKPVLGLQKNVSKAAAIRAMCQTSGFQVLKDVFETRVKKVSIKMLDPTLSIEEVMKLRQRVQVWLEIESVLAMIERTGKFSAETLAKMEVDFTKSPISYGQGETK
jgi:hypothetical protein